MLKKITIRPAFIACALLSLIIAVMAQAPSVSLRTLDGETVNLADTGGKVVVLSFGATWVPLSGRELPAYQKLADRYAGRRIDFYWVSINPTKTGARQSVTDEQLKAFAAKYRLKLTVLRDPDKTAFSALGVENVPTVVILDATGNIHHKHEGFDPDQADGYGEVSQVLDKLLK